MDIIQTWQALNGQEQERLLLTNIKKAMREEIPAARRSMYEPHEFLAEAWMKTNERFSFAYLNGTNDERAENNKAPISFITLVYRCAKDAVRDTVNREYKHDHVPLDFPDDDGNSSESYYLYGDTNQRRKTEERAISYLFWNEFEDSLDSLDRIIFDGLRNGYTQCTIAASASVSAVAIHKRVVKLRRYISAELR